MGSPRKDCDERPEGSERRLGIGATDESGEMEGSGSPGPSDAAGNLAGTAEDACQLEPDADSVPALRDAKKWAAQWLRALDLQVLGACRADERLKPLLKLNMSSGAAEDQLMTQLSQHFEVSEIGMLARCLCVPLVSLRVGKVEKQGTLLHPTSVRGHLNLTLLPTSKLRLSFAGDDGQTERLALVSNDCEGSEVIIEEISADSSGRSFLVKLLESQVLYYWCSEKSLACGMELLAKMSDLLVRRPTLSDLTGISESRLNSFAAHLGSKFAGLNIGELKLTAPFYVLGDATLHESSQSSAVPKSSRFRLSAAHTARVAPIYQTSLSPRSNTFKDGAARTPSCMRIGTREKLKKRGECSFSASSMPNLTNYSASMLTLPALCTSSSEAESPRNSSDPGPVSFILPGVSLPFSSFDPLNLEPPPTDAVVQNSAFKPYYCWCPPGPSSLHYSPSVSPEPLSLPPTLFSAVGPSFSMMPPKLATDAVNLPSLDLPPLLHDPLVHLPLPIPPLASLPSSQLPTFTPLMSDPIVHIPVIDVCSSGQAYLVSAGPAISSAIPPLVLPSLVDPLTPETESLVERNARETLRRLIASSPTFEILQSLNASPTVLGNMDENASCPNVNRRDAPYSDLLFGASCWANDITGGISSMQLCSLNQEAADGDDDGSEICIQEEHGDTDDYDPLHLQKSS